MTVVWSRGPIKPRQKRYTVRVYWSERVVDRDEPHFNLTHSQDFDWLWQARWYAKNEPLATDSVEIIDNHQAPPPPQLTERSPA